MENNNEYILSLIESGLSVIPITEGAKNPHWICLDDNKKHNLVHERATLEEVKKWIEGGVTSWAIAGGEVSGNKMTLDFDEKHYPGLYELWYAKLSDDQKVIVDTCYKNKTRNNGTHIAYRTETSQATIKLARKFVYNTKEKKEKLETIAETKAEGGYTLIPPSAGYKTLGGSLFNLPLVQDEIHEELIDILRTFNEVEDEPETEYELKSTDIREDRPGDKFNQIATWNEILEPHGWVEDSKNHWRRPGKNKGDGISATTNFDDKPMFYVFSTSAFPFKENKGYSKFHTYTKLNFNGDFSASARSIVELYPEEFSNNENNIDLVKEKLQKISSDIPKIKLIEVLDPIFRELAIFEKITAEAFIIDNIKNHFKLTKEDAKKYISYLNKLRAGLLKERKIAKNKEESLPLIDRDIDFQEAYTAVLDIGIVNVETLKIVTALVVSAQIRPNPPLWLFLIGVPSSFKTELVGLFSAMEEVYTLDTLTENAFASGYVPADGSETQDLLPLLDNKCFIIKDLNTLFSMNEEMVKKILGDLTSIFDGKFQKFTATRGMIEYSALFSMIGCITPSILIKHYNYATQLGPRFFFLRLPELTDEEIQLGFNKSWTEVNRREKIIKTRQIISSYGSQLLKKIKEADSISVPIEIQEQINKISIFICKARGIAITGKSSFKDEKGNDVEFYEIKDWQVEQPWRILNQLKSLLKILSLINNKTLVNEEEIKLIKPIILSTMPVDRAEILSILTNECGLSRKQLSQKIGKSTKTIGRTMKELEALKIVDSFKDPNMNIGGKAPSLFFIVEDFASILDAPVPPQESLSLSKNNTQEIELDVDDEDTAF